MKPALTLNSLTSPPTKPFRSIRRQETSSCHRFFFESGMQWPCLIDLVWEVCRKFTSFFSEWFGMEWFLGFFFFFYFLISVFFLIFFKFRNLLKKKIQNDVFLAQLTAGHNWSLTEYQIDNNWKLEDWNEKDWKLEG